MTKQQEGRLKIALAIFTMVGGTIGLVTFVNGGVDERIDNKINVHERDFELKQKEVVGEIKMDVATLKEQGVSQQRQLDRMERGQQHNQELLEQLIRDQ
jgi:hypothetical protein